MTPRAQQAGRPGAALTVAGALAAVAVGALAACEPPARVKPWGHAPDPLEEASHEPRSPALARDEVGAAVRSRRDHTLRIHVDAEPRQLNPMVAPSLWTRRIALGTVFETLIRYLPPDGGA